ncbi:MAG: hypothetical protein V3V08_00525 [Nannocystaceae bacterium]
MTEKPTDDSQRAETPPDEPSQPGERPSDTPDITLRISGFGELKDRLLGGNREMDPTSAGSTSAKSLLLLEQLPDALNAAHRGLLYLRRRAEDLRAEVQREGKGSAIHAANRPIARSDHPEYARRTNIGA